MSGHDNLSWTGGLYIQSFSLFHDNSSYVVRYTPGSLITRGHGSLDIRSVRPGDVYCIEYSVNTSSACTIDVYISGRKINSNPVIIGSFEHRFEFTPSIGTIDIVTNATTKFVMEEFRVVKVF